MSQLSVLIGNALSAIDRHPEPSREQLLEALATHRELLERTRAFAEQMERARAAHPCKFPAWAAAGAATMFYRDLAAAQLKPGTPPHCCTVITLDRFPRGHA